MKNILYYNKSLDIFILLKMSVGKTQQDIFNEVKAKGKLDEWVKLGSMYGLTSYTLQTKYFSVRPYKYYDVDGNIVNVSSVQKTYRPDVNNIAVFAHVHTPDPTNVKQSKYKIEEGKLSTTGLATCTALAIQIGTKKFMAHLDAITHIKPIICAINDEIKNQSLNPITLKPFIYAGNLISSISLQKAKDICSSVGIPDKNCKISYVDIFDKVSI